MWLTTQHRLAMTMMLFFATNAGFLLLVSTALLLEISICTGNEKAPSRFHTSKPHGLDVASVRRIATFQRASEQEDISPLCSAWGPFSSSSSTQNHPLSLPLSICSISRGGAGEDRKASGVELRLRNVIRSILATTKGSNILHAALKTLFRALESATGYSLLPKANPQGTKLKKKRARRSADTNVDANVDDKKVIDAASKQVKKSKRAKKSVSKPSVATKMQLKRELKATNPTYRIQQELKAFIKDPPEHLSVATGKNIRIWIVTVEGIGIYEGETFRLRIQFPANYPTVPPSVYFLPPNIPLHEHVYTNGDICLSLLGKDWRPTMTAQSVAYSILSILASATSKSLPMDNARHAQNQPGQYQADWVYHDDNC
jgi:ubiquitin-conjugating enzyme E2 W